MKIFKIVKNRNQLIDMAREDEDYREYLTEEENRGF
jgi:hypothetical protein